LALMDLTQDTITPGARIEAERRLKALERELAERLQANRERTFASRYHKVKFFGTLAAWPLIQNGRSCIGVSGSCTAR